MSFEPARARHPAPPAPRLAAVLAGAMVVAAGLALVHEVRGGRDVPHPRADRVEAGPAAREGFEELALLGAGKAEAPASRSTDELTAGGAWREDDLASLADAAGGRKRDEDAGRTADAPAGVLPVLPKRLAERGVPRASFAPAPSQPEPAEQRTGPAPGATAAERTAQAPADLGRHGPGTGDRLAQAQSDRRGRLGRQPAPDLARADERPEAEGEPAVSGLEKKSAKARQVPRSPRPVEEATASAAPLARSPEAAARRYLTARETLEGLAFREATGYWSNTYVPGDPVLRVLSARLAHAGPAVLRARLEGTLPNWQPFDPPRDAALALYVHADKAAVERRSRLRVQVGLQATARRSGQRPAMNVGVVLDLRGSPAPSDLLGMRALVTALARARRPGDRFSLTVAGRADGLVVAPEDFRHGPLQLAMQRILGERSGPPGGGASLLSALRAAASEVRRGDDAAAPLGASLVLLVSTSPLGGERAAIERLVHENAVAGVALSAVALGRGAELTEVDRLVLLGQGHRRALASPEDAERLVDEELHASSRAVARAVRLRIRLAPGVRLVDVMGAERLDEPQAERVRESERSIDRRMARNLGIRADRGEDEEGVQIVIPSFYAGDTHVVLLDVVTEGPGPVADATARYKDLVYRRNGVASARLDVDGRRRPPGPLERNVLKNELAHVLAETARRASARIAAGDRQSALRELRDMHTLLQGMRLVIPGWQRDPELGNDETLLAEFVTALQSARAGGATRPAYLAEALRYTAHRRLVPAWE